MQLDNNMYFERITTLALHKTRTVSGISRGYAAIKLASGSYEIVPAMAGCFIKGKFKSGDIVGGMLSKSRKGLTLVTFTPGAK